MIESAIDKAVNKAVEETNLFYQKLKDLEAFDQQFVRPILISQLGITEHEGCYLASYHRAGLNTSSAIALNHVKHFQAQAMLSRSLFEIAVEIRLIEKIPNAIRKSTAFHQLEKLRAAEKSVKFATSHTSLYPYDLTEYRVFISLHRAAIENEATSLWGSLKVKHWSQMDLASRAKMLGEPFEEIYESLYKQFSWHVHPGAAGIMVGKPESFAYLSGISFQISAESYEQILRAVIANFHLRSANPSIGDELQFASLRCGANGDLHVEQKLRSKLGLEPMDLELLAAGQTGIPLARQSD